MFNFEEMLKNNAVALDEVDWLDIVKDLVEDYELFEEVKNKQ